MNIDPGAPRRLLMILAVLSGVYGVAALFLLLLTWWNPLG